jgi:hypothetical protein
MQFVGELSDEANRDRSAGDAGDHDVGMPRVGDRGAGQVVVGERREQVPRVRAGDVDRAQLGGLVDQVHVQVEAVDPVAEPRLHPVCAARRRRQEVGAVAERGQEPVVHHVAGLVERQQVARPAGRDRADVEGNTRSSNVRASTPATRNFPSVDTSITLARSRTARISSPTSP